MPELRQRIGGCHRCGAIGKLMFGNFCGNWGRSNGVKRNEVKKGGFGSISNDFLSGWDHGLLGMCVKREALPWKLGKTVIPKYNDSKQPGKRYRSWASDMPDSGFGVSESVEKNISHNCGGNARTHDRAQAVGDVSSQNTSYMIAGAAPIALIGTSFPILIPRKDMDYLCTKEVEEIRCVISSLIRKFDELKSDVSKYMSYSQTAVCPLRFIPYGSNTNFRLKGNGSMC